MADSKISNLSASTALLTTDELVIASSGASKKITAANARKFMPGYELDYVQITSPVAATTGTTATAITGNSVSYDGSTRVKIEVSAPYLTQSASGGAGYLILFDGSTEIGVLCAVAHSATDEIDVPCHGAVFLTPSNASHTYTIKIRSPGGGTATIQAGSGGSSTNNYPAWYRITIA